MRDGGARIADPERWPIDLGNHLDPAHTLERFKLIDPARVYSPNTGGGRGGAADVSASHDSVDVERRVQTGTTAFVVADAEGNMIAFTQTLSTWGGNYYVSKGLGFIYNDHFRGGAPLLAVRDLEAWYGESHVLHGISFDVAEGEVVTLLGRNGAGKTTTLKAVMGIMSRRAGSVTFGGQQTIGMAARHIARLGMAYCPEERGIFSSLSVEENLMLPPQVRPGGLSVAQIFELFPNLKERLSSQGTKLSGGEQQMLAIARILRTGARMLLLDEPTEGLAPVIVQQIGRTIGRLKSEGFTIVLVEQNFRFAASVADRHYVVEQGKVIDTIPNQEIDRNIDKLHAYLGV